MWTRVCSFSVYKIINIIIENISGVGISGTSLCMENKIRTVNDKQHLQCYSTNEADVFDKNKVAGV